MRIAFALPAPEEYGFGRYLRSLLAGLAKIDAENEYFLFTVGDAARPIVERPPKTREIPLRARRPAMLWRQGPLARACREHRIDLVHFHNNTFWLRKPVPTIVSIHHVSYAYPPEEETVSAFERAYIRFLFRTIARSADGVLTDSASSAADLKRLLRIDATVVPLAPDPRFVPAAPRRFAKPYFFFAGSLGIRKNLPAMIRAFARFNRGTHEFVIAGSAPRAFGYRETPLDGLPLQNVRFLGFVPDEDLPSLYSGADALFYATSYEGFGMPILEAFACGCPVVTSTTASGPEVAGGAAVLVDPTDEAAMAEALHRAIAERESLLERGFRRVRDFSWDRTARATLDAYRRILSGS